MRGCGATACACQGLRFRTLDTQDARERKKLPGSVAKLLKGYELRAWWFEIFECGRKARPLAASNTCLAYGPTPTPPPLLADPSLVLSTPH